MKTEVVDLIARLKRIEGQIRGIQKMITESRECSEILGQLMASRAAIDKVAVMLMNDQVERCLQGDSSTRDEAQKALRETLKAAIKFK